MLKTVLIISYNYPPMNNGGVQRPFKFAKYLPQNKYKCVIISNSNYGKLHNEHNIYRFNDKSESIKQNSNIILVIIFKILRKILYLLGIIPDYEFLWCRKVIKNIKQIIEKENIDIVFSTYPVISNMIIGKYIKRNYNLPLVLDFRDGFVFEPLHKENFIRTLVNKVMEKNLIKFSDFVITVTDPITNYFKTKYNINNIYTITNGFDIDDFQNLKKINLGDKINIVYTGRLSKSSPDIKINKLISAINNLNINNIVFHFYGEYTVYEINEIKRIKNNKVFINSQVERKRALEIQKSADILLFITSKERTSVATTKLFEYMASNKPILALTKDTVAEKIINNTHIGICADPDDENSIKKVLKIISDENYNFFHPSNIEIYSRKILTKKLALLFDNLLNDKNEII